MGTIYIPVLQTHALNTRSDTNLNHTGLDFIGNINTRLQSRATLTVQALDCRGCRKASHQGRGTKLGSATSWWEYRADSDVFDERRVDLRADDESFERSHQ